MFEAVKEAGVTLRAGLHSGEIELRSPEIAGVAVHIASRVADLADPLEILVSRSVAVLASRLGWRVAIDVAG